MTTFLCRLCVAAVRRDIYIPAVLSFSKMMRAVMRKCLSEGNHKERTIRALVKRNVSGGIQSHEFRQHLKRAVKDNLLMKVRATPVVVPVCSVVALWVVFRFGMFARSCLLHILGHGDPEISAPRDVPAGTKRLTVWTEHQHFPRSLSPLPRPPPNPKIGERYALLEINDGPASTAPASPVRVPFF